MHYYTKIYFDSKWYEVRKTGSNESLPFMVTNAFDQMVKILLRFILCQQMKNLHDNSSVLLVRLFGNLEVPAPSKTHEVS